MRDGRLVFNNENGRYGIKYSNTNIWLNEGLSDGDNICVFDYTIDHWVDEYIISTPPGNTPDSWSLKVTGMRGVYLHSVLVRMEED